jgi:hypothetical protein
MGVGMPSGKRLEKPRIWPPGVASRPGSAFGGGRSPGYRRGWGGGISEIKFFEKRTLGNLHWGSVVDPTETLDIYSLYIVLIVIKIFDCTELACE